MMASMKDIRALRAFLLLPGLVLASLVRLPQAQKPPVSQKPEQVAFSPITAEELIAFCKDVDSAGHTQDAITCLTYIAGFVDGYNIAMAKFNKEIQSQFCPPADVTRTQMAKVIVKYGADHPNYLWAGAPLFTVMALKDALSL